jgi:antitoxin PrlF
MSTLEITSLSSRGQIVIPNNIRSEMNLHTGDKMVVISDGDNILLKKVEAPKPEDFKKLLKNSREYAQSVGLKKSDLKNGLKEVRPRK